MKINENEISKINNDLVDCKKMVHDCIFSHNNFVKELEAYLKVVMDSTRQVIKSLVSSSSTIIHLVNSLIKKYFLIKSDQLRKLAYLSKKIVSKKRILENINNYSRKYSITWKQYSNEVKSLYKLKNFIIEFQTKIPDFEKLSQKLPCFQESSIKTSSSKTVSFFEEEFLLIKNCELREGNNLKISFKHPIKIKDSNRLILKFPIKEINEKNITKFPIEFCTTIFFDGFRKDFYAYFSNKGNNQILKFNTFEAILTNKYSTQIPWESIISGSNLVAHNLYLYNVSNQTSKLHFCKINLTNGKVIESVYKELHHFKDIDPYYNSLSDWIFSLKNINKIGFLKDPKTNNLYLILSYKKSIIWEIIIYPKLELGKSWKLTNISCNTNSFFFIYDYLLYIGTSNGIPTILNIFNMIDNSLKNVSFPLHIPENLKINKIEYIEDGNFLLISSDGLFFKVILDSLGDEIILK